MKFTVKKLLAVTLLAALLINGIVNQRITKRLNENLRSDPPLKVKVSQLEEQKKVLQRAVEANEIRLAKYQTCEQAFKVFATTSNDRANSKEGK